MKKQIYSAVILGFVAAGSLWSCGTASVGNATSMDGASNDGTQVVLQKESAPITDKDSGTEDVVKRKRNFEDQSTIVTESSGPCKTDADCVRASCCHPKACVDIANTPDCKDVMCTMDCQSSTMDCGGGNCVCREGQCAVKWNKRPIIGDKGTKVE